MEREATEEMLRYTAEVCGKYHRQGNEYCEPAAKAVRYDLEFIWQTDP